MKIKEARTQLYQEVFPAELEEIRKRRDVVGVDASALENHTGPPSTDLGLVGFALSGGGIRSATISLGVLQELGRHGALDHMDYLSTVSGGGFIGSSMSSLLNDPEVKHNPLVPLADRQDPPALTHLRNLSNYMSPGGLLNTLRLPTLFIRGVLLNLLLFVPAICIAVFASEVIYELWNQVGWQIYHLPMILLPFAALVVALPLVTGLFRTQFTWKVRDQYEGLLTWALVGALTIYTLLPLIWLVSWAIDGSWIQLRDFIWYNLKLAGIWPIVAVVVGLVTALVLGLVSNRVAAWYSRLAMLALGMVGPALMLFTFLSLCLFTINSPFLDVDLADDLDRAAAAYTTQEPAGTPVCGVEEKDPILSRELQEAFCGKGIDLGTYKIAEQGNIWTFSGSKSAFTVEHRSDVLYVDKLTIFAGNAEWLIYGTGLVILLFNLFLVNVNITSPHSSFRDRISRAYLFQVKGGDIVLNDEVKLTELNQEGSRAPYHLINVTLNLHGSRDPNLRGRNGDFFFFSKHFSGCRNTGYVPTSVVEKFDRQLNLGTALTISAGAAAPNMGPSTVRQLVFLMTLLNIRLGYWLPNPERLINPSLLTRMQLTGPGPMYLLKEAISDLDSEQAFVNLSDGGHIENLGIYPLLQRRCRFIVAVDGEADPNLTFFSMVNLIRYARIDMGIEIDIDLRSLRPDENGKSNKHWVVGKIQYCDGQVGHLLYLKSSFTGDEAPYVLDYRARHPSFPHESTADQFFNEEQFEAYRALGEHIARMAREEGGLKEFTASASA